MAIISSKAGERLRELKEIVGVNALIIQKQIAITPLEEAVRLGTKLQAAAELQKIYDNKASEVDQQVNEWATRFHLTEGDIVSQEFTAKQLPSRPPEPVEMPAGKSKEIETVHILIKDKGWDMKAILGRLSQDFGKPVSTDDLKALEVKGRNGKMKPGLSLKEVQKTIFKIREKAGKSAIIFHDEGYSLMKAIIIDTGNGKNESTQVFSLSKSVTRTGIKPITINAWCRKPPSFWRKEYWKKEGRNYKITSEGRHFIIELNKLLGGKSKVPEKLHPRLVEKLLKGKEKSNGAHEKKTNPGHKRGF